MFVIRSNQMEVLTRPARDAFVNAMIVHCKTYFPEVVSAYDDESLENLVAETIKHARTRYGMHCPQGLCRFINLAATLGWQFDLEPQNAWMRSRFLLNPQVSNPADRIDLLVAEMEYRQQVAEYNRSLEEEFTAA